MTSIKEETSFQFVNKVLGDLPPGTWERNGPLKQA